jgi:hypothetical protein
MMTRLAEYSLDIILWKNGEPTPVWETSIPIDAGDDPPDDDPPRPTVRFEVLAGTLNVRNAPGGAIVAKLYRGDVVECYTTATENAGYVWRQLTDTGNWCAEAKLDYSAVYMQQVEEDVEIPPADGPPFWETVVYRARNLMVCRRPGMVYPQADYPACGWNLIQGPPLVTELSDHWPRMLDNAIPGMQARIFRVFACRRDMSVNENIARLKQFLDLLADRNQYAIVCLSNASIGSYPQMVWPGDGDEWFNMETQEKHRLPRYYTEERYMVNEYPAALATVEALHDHPAIIMWQVCNEPRIEPWNATTATEANSDAIIKYYRTMTDGIWSKDQTRAISPGLLATIQIAPHNASTSFDSAYAFCEKFYTSCPNIHVVSNHIYYTKDVYESGATRPDTYQWVQVDTIGHSFVQWEHNPAYINKLKELLKDLWALGPPSMVLLFGYCDSTHDIGITGGECVYAPFLLTNDRWKLVGDLVSDINHGRLPFEE